MAKTEIFYKEIIREQHLLASGYLNTWQIDSFITSIQELAKALQEGPRKFKREDIEVVIEKSGDSEYDRDTFVSVVASRDETDEEFEFRKASVIAADEARATLQASKREKKKAVEAAKEKELFEKLKAKFENK